MKSMVNLALATLVSVLWLSFPTFSQLPVWSEDFSAYVENTGYEGSAAGPVAIGDYPHNVSKWTLDVSACILSNNYDYVKTREYAKSLQCRDVDGDAVWQSEVIDISGYTLVSFSLEARQSGLMGTGDFFDVYYQTDGGTFARIPNWNGQGNENHTLIGQFTNPTIVSGSGISGNSLVIKVIMYNNGSGSIHALDNILVEADMQYISSTTTQNALKIGPGRLHQHIIGIEVVTSGTANPLVLTSISCNTNGSTQPDSNNFGNATVFYTGNSHLFATIQQFGTTIPEPSASGFDITGTQQLLPGINYFWLAFDTKPGAVIGETVDAECTSLLLSGTTIIPAITAPEGNRLISGGLNGPYHIGPGMVYPTFTDAVTDLNNLGISGPANFLVYPGIYNEQIELVEVAGTSEINTISFQSTTGDPADVILQYSPSSSSENFIVRLFDSDEISFQGITFQNSGTSPYGRVLVIAGASQNVSFSNNVFIGRDINSMSTSYDVISVLPDDSSTCNSVHIQNNSVSFGSTAIHIAGFNEQNVGQGAMILNNNISNFGFRGILLSFQETPRILDNIIQGKSSTSTGQSGIYLNDCTGPLQIGKNQIHLNSSFANNGIYLWYCSATDIDPGCITNNYVDITEGTFETLGISADVCNHLNIFHNTIRTSGSPVASDVKSTIGKSQIYLPLVLRQRYQIPIPTQFNLQIYNNILANYGASTLIYLTEDAMSGITLSSNDNCFYTTTATFAQMGNTGLSDLPAWQLASGQDLNSFVADPVFASAGNPLPVNEVLKQSVPLLGTVPDDLYDQPRANPTTPGAVETSSMVPVNRLVQGSVNQGETQCYDATGTITVENFSVLSGGSADLIAGEAIHILSGTYIYSGAYFHARITTTNQFCQAKSKETGNISTLNSNDASNLNQESRVPGTPDSGCRLYPNPTSGQLSIFFDDHRKTVPFTVELFGTNSEIVLNKDFPASGTCMVDLSGLKAGMYIIRIINQDQVFISRIIKAGE